MTYKDWDDRGRWEDDSKCLVCKADMGKSEALVCSVTCEDIRLLKSRRVLSGLLDNRQSEGWEDDCYA